MARALPSDFARYTSGLTHWRRVIFKRLFGFLAILCVPVYFTSVYLCIAADLWGMAIFDTFAYFLLVLLLFYPHFSDRLRFSLGCLLAYAIGVGFLIAIGPSGAGFFWLFIFPPLSNIFLGTKASIYAQVLNGVSLILIGVAYHYQWLIWPVTQGYSTGIWVVVSINFLVTNAMVTLTIAYLLGKLTSSLDSTLASRQATVLGLAKLAEYRDNETGAHLLRMRQYSKMLATQRMLADNSPPELDEDFIQDISLSAILHDIGKVGIADAILLKPGRLTPDEFEQIKAHPVIGGQVLASLLEYAPQCTFIKMGRDIASGHHEKWDGSGYPLGLKEENIPLSARIVALVDVYDALTSPRCYKRPFTHEDAKAMILEGRAKHFDPVLVDCFMQIHTEFEVLSKASLQDDPQSTVAQPKMV
ncbi:phosphohydrolase [Shewanella xiamenensis]|uniref:HD-GYP domain-containing protein n=1 Tax=Shewanella TaxID=22 RepID=UPI00064928C4|nr:MULTISPECIES: HD domain-containing phosphohydrolase [Shewanella]NSM25250.1 HD domain-containing protein [Shewanella sp. ZOR0012]TVL19355.1 phosphohydrolase [Shewanella xiamenensis]TVL19480.1 phosphohydrolase [Shewanella xiamenensis]TVL25890.1 phosphohydrolase [Shewanella xiamenensis]TVL32469.1 phosphohydrolase [Shewanella xiamenensis]